ncbi:hypothetical protein F443_00651, partial [Phytophthora nicotianae P1569]
QTRNQDTTNPSMMATSNAPPLSDSATHKYMHKKTAATEAMTITNMSDVSFSKLCDSTGERLSRKIKAIPSNKTKRGQDPADTPARKNALYRQYIEARAFVSTGLRR